MLPHILTGSQVRDEALLEPITRADAVPQAIHGTTLANWALIEHSGGLHRMSRRHIHCAPALPDHAPISGMRSSADVAIYIDLPRALADGVPFFRSANGVILTPGVAATGALPLHYLRRAVHRPSGRVLFANE